MKHDEIMKHLGILFSFSSVLDKVFVVDRHFRLILDGNVLYSTYGLRGMGNWGKPTGRGCKWDG